MTGRLGGKVGIAPRLYLKKLVADVLDRIDQFPDFDPRLHYGLTVSDSELTLAERGMRGADSSHSRPAAEGRLGLASSRGDDSALDDIELPR